MAGVPPMLSWHPDCALNGLLQPANVFLVICWQRYKSIALGIACTAADILAS